MPTYRDHRSGHNAYDVQQHHYRIIGDVIDVIDEVIREWSDSNSADRIISMEVKGSLWLVAQVSITSCTSQKIILLFITNRSWAHWGGCLFRDTVRRNRCPACEPPNKNVCLSTQKTRIILKIYALSAASFVPRGTNGSFCGRLVIVRLPQHLVPKIHGKK